MTKEKIKQVMDACYQAKRVRDMMPKLPNGVTPTHIHYLDVITRFERSETDVKVSDISDESFSITTNTLIYGSPEIFVFNLILPIVGIILVKVLNHLL